MLRMELKPPQPVREEVLRFRDFTLCLLRHRELRSYRSRFHGKRRKEGLTRRSIVNGTRMLRETTQTAEFGTYPRYSRVKSGMGALEKAAFRNTNFSVSFSSECGLKKCRARERKDSPEGAMYGASLG